jgi:enolase
VWLDLLMDVLHQLGLRDHFNLMIDASAGHLRHADRYVLSITDESSYTSEEFLEYWSDLLREYPIAILEDPFSEDDFASWQGLSSAFPDRVVASDNLCAADSARVIDAAHQGCMSAVIIKPSQAGTVSDAVSVFQTCLKNGLVPIPSHRSIDTADEFLSDLCCVFGVSRVKLGLLSDFDTVSRLNALIRNFEQAGS